jgi:hypothetical protein
MQVAYSMISLYGEGGCWRCDFKASGLNCSLSFAGISLRFEAGSGIAPLKSGRWKRLSSGLFEDWSVALTRPLNLLFSLRRARVRRGFVARLTVQRLRADSKNQRKGTTGRGIA